MLCTLALQMLTTACILVQKFTLNMLLFLLLLLLLLLLSLR